MKLGLVLGAGGVVGMSYHAGVLHALAEEGGLDVGAADLIVGTSAGSVMGALLRTGWTPADCWAFAREEHPLVAGLDEAERTRRRAALLKPRGGSAAAIAARAIGSAYVATRSVLRAPLPPVPGFLARRFPAGMFDNGEAWARISEVMPPTWPGEPLWLVAVDVGTGRRVVLRRGSATGANLHQAVMASCAIPGVFPPVRVGQRTMVDGGAHSTTHLDLAAEWGCDLIVGIAPMAFDPSQAPGRMSQLARRVPSRSLAKESRLARARRASVLLLRPSAAELEVHGRDPMRPADPARIAELAYEHTVRTLATPRFRRLLAGPEETEAA